MFNVRIVVMMFNKKADMSIQTVVVAVLALIVLLVLIFIFYQQMSGANSNFKLFRDKASTDYCMSLGFTRQCVKQADPGCVAADGWQEVSPPTYCSEKNSDGTCKTQLTRFKDCNTASNKGDMICCEKAGDNTAVKTS